MGVVAKYMAQYEEIIEKWIYRGTVCSKGVKNEILRYNKINNYFL
jgi:hypothetical protein